MNSSPSHRKWFTGLLGLAACLAVSLPSTPAAGGDKYWIGGDGWWSDATKWSYNISQAPPTAGDRAFLTQSDATNRTVWYNFQYIPTGSLAELQIDATGSGTMTLSQQYYPGYFCDLASNYEYVGYNGTGAHLQSFGTNTVSNVLYLGYNPGGRGTYRLNDSGSLSAVAQHIGFEGTGAFDQSGGTNTVSGINGISLGTFETGRGSYTLSGGSLSALFQCLGVHGTGVFTQSGGTNSVTRCLYLGEFQFGRGTYELSGNGSLSVGKLSVGDVGTGIFKQTGGTNTVSGDLFLGYNTIGYDVGHGEYELSGDGRLSALNQYIGNGGTGAFTQSGGSNTASNCLLLGYAGVGRGTYELSGGSLSAKDAIIGYEGVGLFKQTGGVNASKGSLRLGAFPTGSGAYELSDGSLSAQIQVIGMQGSGSFTQTGGTNTANSLHELGSFAGSRGTYELRGGSLAVWNQNIGYWGTGTFKQSGGDNAVSNNLVLGFSDSGTGTYELSGTSSLSARNQYIGGYGTFNNLTYVGGTGIFKQSGGTNTVSEYLFLGFNLGSRGEYVLSDGSLRSLTLTLGYPGGSGFFTQNGGTNISNGLGVLHGDYNLNGGSLSAPIQIFGYWGVEGYGLGRFIQSGGTNTATDYITLYGYYGGHGAYLLQGGVLNAGTINVWPNGFFNQTGGALTAATFNLQGGEVQGSLENRGTFNYNSGTFSGRLRNYGTVNFGSEFTLGNGLANYAALTLAAGRTLTLNGAGLDNQGTLTLDGGTLAGSGPLVNNATLSGYGAINAPGGLSNAGTMTLTGGSTTVQGDVANQASGQLSMVNSSALFTGNVTNSGTIKATKATVTFAGTYTEQGAYISNPSNTYAQTIVVTPSGYFQGGKGDSWFISNDFINRSAQNLLWDTALAGLTFSGPTGTVHEMYLPGANLGPNCFAHNFAWGSLDITGQNLRLLDGNTTPGGAQYVGEILGVILSGSLVTNITGNGLLDLYYNSSLPGNAYLGSRTFDLTGGGHLAPIPAPSTYLLLATGLAGLLAARGKRRR